MDKASKFFWFLGIGMTAVLAAAVLTLTRAGRQGVGEPVPPRPDFARTLPAGAAFNEGSAVALPDPVAPAYVAGYAVNGRAEAALLVWERGARRYAAVSTIALESEQRRLVGIPRLASESLGSGTPTVIVASGPFGAYTDGIFLLTRDGNALRFVRMRDAAGAVRPAFFTAGASVMNAEEFMLEDVNADGRRDAVATSRSAETIDGKARTQVGVKAYLWSDEGFFAYDPELSDALTMSKRIFPEP